MIAEYLGLAIMLGAIAALSGVSAVAYWIATARRSAGASVESKGKSTVTPESRPAGEAAGDPTIDPTGEPARAERAIVRGRHAVEFYLVALLFGLLEVAAVFLYAWGAAFRELGWGGLASAALFALPLVVAVVYQWRNGVFEW